MGAHHSEFAFAMVGTSLTRLCPPYKDYKGPSWTSDSSDWQDGISHGSRLIEAGHKLVVHDQRKEASINSWRLAPRRLVAKGRRRPHRTVLASLPWLQASLDVATGANGVIEGKRVKTLRRFLTVGSQMAVRLHDLLAKRNIVQLDSPVSGGVAAPKRHAGVMVSGPRAEFEAIKPALAVIGKVFFIGENQAPDNHEAREQFPVGDRGGCDLRSVVMGVKAGSIERDDRRDQRGLRMNTRVATSFARDPAAQLRFRLRDPG